jgi:hypothetical protein
MDAADAVRQRLAEAIRNRDADAFEAALSHAFQAGLRPDWSDMLSEALLMSWHCRHEDLARALQMIRAPDSVEALFAASSAKHEYLSYDEFFGLARKCTWALADIGSPEAKHRLAQLAQCSNPTIAAHAQQRLDQWQHELARKRK